MLNVACHILLQYQLVFVGKNALSDPLPTPQLDFSSEFLFYPPTLDPEVKFYLQKK